MRLLYLICLLEPLVHKSFAASAGNFFDFLVNEPVMSTTVAQSIKLPTLQEVQELWQSYGMLPNIRRHSHQVCRVALAVCHWLDEAGFHLNSAAIEVGALLHDVAKAYCLNRPELRHNLEGQRILEQAGYAELGRLVAKHVNLPSALPLDEAVVVFYADKRVVGDKVVSVAERFQYIKRKYGQGKAERMRVIERDEALTYEVERHIFKIAAGHSPRELAIGVAGGQDDTW